LDNFKKETIIVAGANGVGKTTFAREFLLEYNDYEYLNADEIAKEISPENPSMSKISAGKIFFKKFDEFVENKKSFLLESTLSGRYLIRFIKLLLDKDYQIRIVFIFVDSVEILTARIEDRVKKGGHFVPEEDVRRRLKRGKVNFWNFYRDLVTRWNLIYNSENSFQDIAFGEKSNFLIINEDLFQNFKETAK
jgi:predicted ABC-type ATPase